MTTRTVTGTIFHLDGSAWQSAPVVFELLEMFETTTQVYPLDSHTEITDSNGAFSITLGVPAAGSAKYRVNLPDQNAYEFYLAAGSSVDLVSLITSPEAYVAPTVSALDSHIATYFRSGTWNPTITGVTSGAGVFNYTVIGKMCFAHIYLHTGTGSATTYTITAPFKSANMVMAYYSPGYGTDAGSALVSPALASIGEDLDVINLYKDWSLADWTPSGARAFFGTLVYQIA